MQMIKPVFSAFVIAVLAFAAFGARPQGERMNLWPEGKMPDAQGHLIAEMTDVAGRPGFKPEEHRDPYLEWHAAPSNACGVCVILISGGGYDGLCDIGLIEYWQRKFAALGCQTVNLVYRSPRPKGLEFYRTAWEDGQRAVRLVRSEAAKRGFSPDKIGTCSMSAGSHLATLLATSSLTPAYAAVDELDVAVPCHLNFAVTCAIAYALTDGLGKPNSRGGDAADARLDDCFRFDMRTAPMCMFHGGADEYSPIASTRVFRRLHAMKVPAELHLFADRGHGFFGGHEGLETSTGYDNWFGRAEEFLNELGILPGAAREQEELLKRFPDDDARANYEKFELWPAGKMPDPVDGIEAPYLEWHTPKELKTKAIQIVYSGGAYCGNSPESFEVTPIRRYLNAKGMTVVTMKYRCVRPPRTPLAKHTRAWQDLQRTVRLVRSEAVKRGLDPDRIGIMGSSAGGHLTLMGALSSRHRAYLGTDEIDRLPAKVNWAVAIYPAYVLSDGFDDCNSIRGDSDLLTLAPEFDFDFDSAPMLFIHGDEDVYSPLGSVRVWERLRTLGVGSDLHLLARRNHCFQNVSRAGTGSYTWMDRIWEFMNHKGFNR